MPVFGEYETIGRPFFMNARRGPLRTFWVAKLQALEQERVYVVKSVALPGSEPGEQRAAEGHPIADRGAVYFQGARRMLEAYRADPEHLVPIHSFGKTQTEFWYATDCYPRRSLAELESTSKDINNAGLGHLVYSVAIACLALQRATGQSHGNLKPGNVLLEGDDKPLKRTTLRLIDAAGSSRIGASPESSEPHTDAATCDATEAHDLHGIGQIILQLVESRPVEGPEDYALPIETSAPWKVLGKHSNRWVDLCNRLLDPDLSLNEISLESLAKDFKPRPRFSRTTVILTALGVVIAGAIASYPIWDQHLWRVKETLLGDFQRALSRVMEAPSTSEHNASTPVVTDTASETVNPAILTTNSGAGEVGFATSTTKPAPSSEPTPPDLETQVLNSGAPAVSEIGRAAGSNIQSLQSEPRATEPAAPATGSPPKPVRAAAPPVPAPLSPPQRSSPVPRELSQTAISGAKPSRETNSERSKAARPAERRAKASPDRAEMARAEPSHSRASPGPETSTPGQLLMDTAVLDRELRELEVTVGKVVAIRRNSDLFARLDSLEKLYAKAHRLSGPIKKRLELLRSNMAKKLPGAFEPGSSPITTGPLPTDQPRRGAEFIDLSHPAAGDKP